MSSTTAVTVQVTSCSPLSFGTHFTTKAVPSTAAVVPPALTSNEPVSETFAARFQVSPTERVPWVWRPPCSFGELGDGEDRRSGEPREGAVGVVDLGPAGRRRS